MRMKAEKKSLKQRVSAIKGHNKARFQESWNSVSADAIRLGKSHSRD